MGRKTELCEVTRFGPVLKKEVFSEALGLLRRYGWSRTRIARWVGVSLDSISSLLLRDQKAAAMWEEARADYERQFTDPAKEKLLEIINEDIEERGSPLLVSAKKKIQYDAAKFLVEKLDDNFKPEKEKPKTGDTNVNKGLVVNITFQGKEDGNTAEKLEAFAEQYIDTVSEEVE